MSAIDQLLAAKARKDNTATATKTKPVVKTSGSALDRLLVAKKQKPVQPVEQKPAPPTPASSLAFMSPKPLPTGLHTSTAQTPVSGPMVFKVGEGMNNTTDVLPGPRKSTLEAVKRGETVNVTQAPVKTSEVTKAKTAVGIDPVRKAAPTYSKFEQAGTKMQGALDALIDEKKNLAVKLTAKPVGQVVGAAGAVIGGAVGGFGNLVETRRNGKQFDKTQFWKDVIETSKSTKDFGTEIGTEGAKMATLGAVAEVPGAIGVAGETINALAMIPQVSQVYSDVKEGKVSVETGLNAGMALMFGVGATKSLPEFARSLRSKSDVHSIVSSAADTFKLPVDKDSLGRTTVDKTLLKQRYEEAASQGVADPHRLETAKQVLEDYGKLSTKEFQKKYQEPLVEMADTVEQIGAAPKSKVSETQKDNGTLIKVEHPAGGRIDAMQKDGAVRVVYSENPEAVRGKGYGKEMYKELIEVARKKELPMVSDTTVEPGAVRVYESLKKEGYNVIQNSEAKKLEDGTLYAPGLKEPVFRVETTKPEFKPIIDKSLTPEEQKVSVEVQQRAHEKYLEYKAKYLEKNAAFDESGNLQSIDINTDEWRSLFPEYHGTDAHVTHEAASYLNGKLLEETLPLMKGKGNNTVMVKAGGGGSGKGTAIKQFFDEKNYPIRLDQVFADFAKGNKKLQRMLNDFGYKIDYVFVDANPVKAGQNIISRALHSREQGKLARTVKLERGAIDNVDARDTAKRVFTEIDNPNVRKFAIDNNGGRGQAVILDGGAALDFLSKTSYSKDEALAQLYDYARDLHGRKPIPSDIAEGLGLRGPENDRLLQLRSDGGGSGVGREGLGREPNRTSEGTGREIGTPKSVGETKTSAVGSSIKAKALEQDLTKTFGETAQYTAITVKEQAAMAADLISRDAELAKRMVRGEVPMEPGLLGGTLIKAMEDYAMKTGDAQLALDIAKSPLTSETSIHAQEMRMLAERNPESAVANIQRFRKAKEEGMTKKIGAIRERTMGELQTAIKKAKKAATKETWGSFIDSITCT